MREPGSGPLEGDEPAARRSSEETSPYDDSLDHLLDELERVDLLLRRHLETWWTERGDDADQFRGLYISDREVDDLLRTAPRDGVRPARDESLAGDGTALARRIHRRKRRSAEAGRELRLVSLADRLDLDARHVDVLLLALAPELHRKYEKVYAYLQDDIGSKRPTAELVSRVLADSGRERVAVRAAFSEASPLVRNGALRLVGGRETPLPSRSLVPDRRVVEFLLDSDAPDAGLGGVVTVETPERGLDDLLLADETRAALERLVRGRRGDGDDGAESDDGDRVPSMTYCYGPGGTTAAAAAVCAEVGTPLLTLDVAAGVDADVDAMALLDRAIREARLRGASVCVGGHGEFRRETGEGADSGVERVVRALDEYEGDVFLTGTEPLTARVRTTPDRHRLSSVRFPTPPFRVRRALWERVEALPPDADPATLASAFRFTAEQVADAVTLADADVAGDALTREAVYGGCRAVASPDLGSRARRVEPGYEWDDIVLPSDTMANLREVAARIEHRGRVYDEWGFDGKYALGNGLVVLFTGPSGTGKTMAAEVVADDAGLDLYKVDLSHVVSKYVGETERNLGEIFDRAEDADAVLLFDEADALFGERSEVRDAHDRYANVEVDYLLQRIEAYHGAAILTTNLKQNVDDAFLRRIHASVEFPLPDRGARRDIWQAVFPAETPVEDVDVEFLSEFDLSGGDIKNVALTASFLAAADESAVGMRHLVRAARREFQKADRLATPETFGEYRDHLE